MAMASCRRVKEHYFKVISFDRGSMITRVSVRKSETFSTLYCANE